VAVPEPVLVNLTCRVNVVPVCEPPTVWPVSSGSAGDRDDGGNYGAVTVGGAGQVQTLCTS
jgi:hypothetical protein